MGKVQDDKLTVKFHGSDISRLRSFCRIIKLPNADAVAIGRNSGQPLPMFLTPRHAHKSRRIVSAQSSIGHILRALALTEISLAIIQRIAIFMVRFFSLKKPENVSMHFNVPVSSVKSAISNEFAATRCSMRSPVKLSNTLKVPYINYRNLTLSKWDESVRLCEWLSNRVSLDATRVYTLGHESSAKGFVRLSHFSMGVL